MISIVMALILGTVLGYVICLERDKWRTIPKGRLCVVFNNERRTKFVARLFHGLDEDDEYASVRMFDPNTLEERALPLFVRKDKVRFYTDEGEAINMANWDQLKFTAHLVASGQEKQ